jgi:hypothetical protein
MNRTTTQAQYRFVVKETGVGGYFLMLEPLDGTLPVRNRSPPPVNLQPIDFYKHLGT